MFKLDSDGTIPAEDILKYLEELMEMSADDNIKEVKLAWANGETVQYVCLYKEIWTDWPWDDRLILDSHEEWRVKPKPTVIAQWERKYFRKSDRYVYTMIMESEEDFRDVHAGENTYWVTEPELVEYEIERTE